MKTHEIDVERDVEAKRIFVVPGSIFSFKINGAMTKPVLQIILSYDSCCEKDRLTTFVLTYKDVLEWKCDMTFKCNAGSMTITKSTSIAEKEKNYAALFLQIDGGNAPKCGLTCVSDRVTSVMRLYDENYDVIVYDASKEEENGAEISLRR